MPVWWRVVVCHIPVSCGVQGPATSRAEEVPTMRLLQAYEMARARGALLSLATVIFTDNRYSRSATGKNGGHVALHNPDQFCFEFIRIL